MTSSRIAIAAAALFAVVACRKETKPAVLSVAVSHVKPNGRSWDEESGTDARPDIAMCVSYKDGRHCFTGDKPNLDDAACKDALSCQTTLDVPTGPVAVEVWDIDTASEELIARGQCHYGETCDLGGAVVAIADQPKSLAEPPPGKVAACANAPLDAAALAALPKNPAAAKPFNKRSNDLVDIYDYEAPNCAGQMFTLDKDDPTSWSAKCHRTCVDPAKAGLGTLKALVSDNPDAGPKTTWYLVTDGPLKDAVVTFAPLPEGGHEVTVASVTGVLDEPAYFIASWLCKNPGAAPGVNASKCQ